MTPWAPAKPCQHPGCLARAIPGTNRCAAHKKDRWAGRASSNARGYGAAWRQVRDVVLKQAGHLCAQCGRQATHVDHVRPRSLGGDDSPENLRALCRDCHNPKSGREGAQAPRR